MWCCLPWAHSAQRKKYAYHDDVIKWKHFPHYWPFVRGIHRSPVNSPHKGQWRGALMFSLICVWINGWGNNGEAGDMRRHRAHYDVTVMWFPFCCVLLWYPFPAWLIHCHLPVKLPSTIWIKVFYIHRNWWYFHSETMQSNTAYVWYILWLSLKVVLCSHRSNSFLPYTIDMVYSRSDHNMVAFDSCILIFCSVNQNITHVLHLEANSKSVLIV